MPMTASVTNTLSAAMPKNAFGKLNSPNFTISACHVCATREQDTIALKSHASSFFGARAKASVSAESMSEVISAIAEKNSITPYVHADECRHPLRVVSQFS